MKLAENNFESQIKFQNSESPAPSFDQNGLLIIFINLQNFFVLYGFFFCYFKTF